MTVSFIVPTRNSARTLQACLRSLVQQDLEDVEVVVVDNHSSDGTLAIAEEWADTVVTAGPERSAQRNLGAFLSRGDVVVFIDSDMVLEPGVARDIREAFDAPTRPGALVIPELAFGTGFFARCRALEKRLYLGDGTVEAVRAIDRKLFEEVGGWDEDLTAGEDWELTDRIKATGCELGRTEQRIWHDEGHIKLRETFTKKGYYGRWVADYVKRPGGSRKLVRTSLFSRLDELAAHPVHAAGMITLKSVEAAGLAYGMARAGQTATATATAGSAA